MKVLIYFLGGLALSLVLIHFFILKSHESFLSTTAKAHAEETQMTSLKEFRLTLEQEARDELSQYRYLDKGKDYAQIPLERAFDYYLAHPTP